MRAQANRRIAHARHQAVFFSLPFFRERPGRETVSCMQKWEKSCKAALLQQRLIFCLWTFDILLATIIHACMVDHFPLFEFPRDFNLPCSLVPMPTLFQEEVLASIPGRVFAFFPLRKPYRVFLPLLMLWLMRVWRKLEADPRDGLRALLPIRQDAVDSAYGEHWLIF